MLSAEAGSSLLFSGIAPSPISLTNSGLLIAADIASGLAAPLHASFSSVEDRANGWNLPLNSGFSGLAFGPAAQRLFGTASSGPESASNLLTMDPYTGVQKVAPVPIHAAAQALDISDLATVPGGNYQLYGLGRPVATPSASLQLYVIDPGSGQAVAIADQPAWLASLSSADALAFGPDGTLYVGGQELIGNAAVLYVQQPNGNDPLVTRHALADSILGMDVRVVGGESQGAQIEVFTVVAGGQLRRLDPAGGQFTGSVALSDPVRGVAGDIAFHPAPDSLMLQQVHHADFETGANGYSADNAIEVMPGMWHHSPGRWDDGLINHTHGQRKMPGFNWYYGQFETSLGGGTYLTDYHHAGILTSPLISVPECANTTLSFSYLLDVRQPLDADFVEVWAQFTDEAGQVERTRLMSRAEGTLPQTGNRWLTATADLSPFAGREVQIQFLFDTGNVPDVDPEGWYVDDVLVASMPKAICGYKWADQNADGSWDAEESGLNEWTVYIDLDDNGHFDPALPERTFAGAIETSTLASGQQVVHPEGQVRLEISATGAPIWAMPDPTQLSRNVLARGTAPGEEVWTVGPMLRANFSVPVHTATLDVARADAVSPTRVVLQAFDMHGNRIAEQARTLDDHQWQTLTISTTGGQIAYLKASVDSGSAYFNHLRYLGTAPTVEGDPAFDTRSHDGHDGAFWFDRLPPGEYTLREVLPEGWKQSFPGSPNFAHSVTVTAGQPVSGRWTNTQSPHFGNFQPDISGYKWDDADRDGAWDEDEREGLNGWTIELYLDSDGDGLWGPDDTWIATTQTTFDGVHDGAFWFTGLEPGEYVLREVPQFGWMQTYPSPPTTVHAVQVDADQPQVGRWQVAEAPNFGNTRIPDLALISKTGLPDPVIAGQELVYTIEVVNLGPGDALGVAVTDLLPPQSRFVSAETTQGSNWQIVAPAPGETGDVLFSKDTVVEGETATFQIAVHIPSDVLDGIMVSNTATISGGLVDPDPSNNSQTAQTLVVTRADLEMNAKTDSPDPVIAGELLTYTIDVIQHGPSDAQQAIVTDLLPAFTTLISATTIQGTGWRMDASTVDETGRVTFSKPTMTPGETASFEMVVRVAASEPEGMTIVNTAVVESETVDPEPTNNTKTAETSVSTAADLEIIAKIDSPDPVMAGERLIYTIDLVNLGPSDAQLVTVSDVLPVCTRFVSAEILNGSGWNIEAPAVGEPGTVRFAKETVAALEIASFQIVVSVIATSSQCTALENTAEAASQTHDPDETNNSKTAITTVLATVPQVVQFITPVSVYREEGLFEPTPVTATLPQWIEGCVWHDLNQDGIWDESELGRKGWWVFLDLNENGVWDAFDPEDPDASEEPFAVTNANGRFVIDVEPGTYQLRVDVANLDLSDGAFAVLSFPGSDGHVIEVKAGEPVIGVPGPSEEPMIPNIGVFAYSPFIRPADDHYGRIEGLASPWRSDLLTALQPWQSFTITNATGADFEITEIQKNIDTGRIAVADQFVTVPLYRKAETEEELKDADWLSVPVEQPIQIPVAPGETVQFFAFYTPATREGDRVIEQYPDWYGGNKQTHPAHTFARDDHLSVTTNAEATFRIDLAGGSTYDSDIVYDGAVDGGDFVHLDGLLNLSTSQNQLQIPFGDPLFDPTADINARCPNGAAGAHATCDWPLFATPPRELGHGDFGPLNVEWDRARAPFLDLDPDNSSGARGVDARTVFTGEQPAPIADSDARFANSVRRVMEQLSFEITGASELPQDRLIVDESKLVPLGLKAEGNGTHHLTLRSSGPEKIAVEQYTTALQYVRFESSLLTDRMVEIRVQAKGAGLHDLESAADVQLGTQIAFTRLDDDAELWGNVAVARVVISRPEAFDTTEPAVVEVAAESESDSSVASRTSYLAAPAVRVAVDKDPGAGSSSEVARESDTRRNLDNPHDVNGDSYDKIQEALPATDQVATEELVVGEAESAQMLVEPTHVEGVLDGPDVQMGAVWTTQQQAHDRVASALDPDSRDAGDRLDLIALADASMFVAPSVVDEQHIPADGNVVLAGEDSEDLHAAVMDVEDLLSDLVEDIAAVGLR